MRCNQSLQLIHCLTLTKSPVTDSVHILGILANAKQESPRFLKAFQELSKANNQAISQSISLTTHYVMGKAVI